jgi:hypothetical protein
MSTCSFSLLEKVAAVTNVTMVNRTSALTCFPRVEHQMPISTASFESLSVFVESSEKIHLNN